MTDSWQMLKSDQPARRWQAVEVLGRRMADDKVLAALVGALNDAHPFVRWQAGQALARSARGRRRLLETLQVRDNSALAQGAAADALGQGKFKPDQATPLLLEALESEDPFVRQSAAEALARRADSRAIPKLIALLDDENLWVQRAAARALGHVGDVSVVTALTQRLSDQEVIVRRSAVYALGALKAEAAVGLLIDALADTDPVVRRNAAWALGRIGPRASPALPALRQLQTDTALDGAIATAAVRAERAIVRPFWLAALSKVLEWIPTRRRS